LPLKKEKIDAVRKAILNLYCAKKVGEKTVFEQNQLKMASELGFGVKSADEITLTPLNAKTQRKHNI
jgi:hypothetical protein